MKTKFTSRSSLALFLPCFCWALVASTTACGDDDDSSGNPSAGSAGKAGSANGGSAGSGNGGSKNGGSAGSSGTDVGGEGPTPVGGAAGANDPGGGDAGMGGDGPTDGPLPQLFNLSATGHDRFYASTFDAAGNLYAVGQMTLTNDAAADIATVIAKFTPAGVLDKTFGNGGVFLRNVQAGTNGELLRNLVVQSTGKIVAFGTIEQAGAAEARERDAVLIRVNADGTKDATFGTDGIKKLNFAPGAVNGSGFSTDSGWGLAKYPGADDRLVVHGGKVRDGGVDTNFVIMRLSADGVPDETFGTHGLVERDLLVEVEDEGSGGAGGAGGAGGLIEVHNNASPRNVTILPGTDGILGAGYQPKPGADTSPVVWKVTDAGVLDNSFGTNGAFMTALLDEQTESYSAVVQPMVGGGYKLVTTGYGRKLETDTTDLVSMRLTSDGKLDTTYGEDGIVQLDVGGFGDNSRNLLVLPDRRVLLVGGGRLTSANVDGAVVVLTPDGEPDTTFGPDGVRLFDLGGPADFFWGVALSPDKKTLGIAGIKGVGNAPMPAYAADDTAVLWFPTP